MTANAAYRVGDAVSVNDGPMRNIFGIVIISVPEKDEYWIRFTGLQQLRYHASQMFVWPHGKNAKDG